MPDDRHIEAEFIDRLYAVAIEPERFTELVDVWQDRLNRALADGRYAVENEIAHLESHVSRAETLLEMADDADAIMPRALAERMEAEPHPMFAIDERGAVCAQNGSASMGFDIREARDLGALPFDEETKETIRRFATNAGGNELTRLLRGYREDNGEPLLLSLSETRTASSRRLCLVRIIDFTWPNALTPLVRDAFELTQAETEVLRLFAEGHSPADIARSREASLSTVRTQIRMLYEKTGTRNQAELIRMAIGLGSLEQARQSRLSGDPFAVVGPGAAPFPRPEDRRLLELPDGRVMEYSVFGAEQGRTCLFLHNEFYGDVWPAEAVHRAIELDIQILAPLRPYYGRSDAGPTGKIGPTQLAHDIAHLFDRLDIDRVVPLFQMAGGLTAAELARLYPQRLAGLVPVAPMFPMGHPQDENQLTAFHNLLSSIIHRHPRLLEFITRSGFAYLKRVGARRFFKTFAVMARGAEVCAGHGHKAFFNDYHEIPPNAQKSFLELDAPVVAVIGDSISAKRNRRLEELAEHHHRAERLVAEGGAHYLHFSHPTLMAEAVHQAFSE